MFESNGLWNFDYYCFVVELVFVSNVHVFLVADIVPTDIQIRNSRNSMAERLYGFSAAEALGKDPIDILVDGQDASVAQNITRRCSSGESWTGEFPVKNKAGERFSVVTTMSPSYDDDGSLIGIICITNDSALFQDPRGSPAKTRGQEGETSFSRVTSSVASKLGLDSKEAVVSKLGLDSQQPLQVAIASKISDLVSLIVGC